MAINAQVKMKEERYLKLRPNFRNSRSDITAVIASTMGYCKEIFSWQSLHFPRRIR
jgi:hypothetical protein